MTTVPNRVRERLTFEIKRFQPILLASGAISAAEHESQRARILSAI